jgi:uncharacterized protein (TIGR03085 family)
MTLAQRERAALADLFDKVGPDYPTLDEGWVSSDLLTHLLMRERRPDTLLAQLVKPLAGWTERVKAGYEKLPWTERVELFRAGPPWFSLTAISAVDAALNDGEHFIHHEDVRRGQQPWEVRTLDADSTATLLKQLQSPFARAGAKKLGIGVVAVLPDGQRIELAKGTPEITVTGEVSELVLWSSGRRSSCVVEIEGSPEALATLQVATG